MSTLKFHQNGKIKWFPGNTIVSNLYPDPNVVNTIQKIQKEYQALPFAQKYSFLPIESVHMTVFELLCHFNRSPEKWSEFLNLDESLEKIDEFFHNKLESLPFIQNLKMKPLQIRSTVLEVDPGDEETNRRLKAFRDQLTEATGVKFANHDKYQFHISFAYLIAELTSEEKLIIAQLNERLRREVITNMEPVKIEKIDYTVFEDMSEFVPYSSEAREKLRVKKGYTTESEMEIGRP